MANPKSRAPFFFESSQPEYCLSAQFKSRFFAVLIGAVPTGTELVAIRKLYCIERYRVDAQGYRYAMVHKNDKKRANNQVLVNVAKEMAKPRLAASVGRSIQKSLTAKEAHLRTSILLTGLHS